METKMFLLSRLCKLKYFIASLYVNNCLIIFHIKKYVNDLLIIYFLSVTTK